MPLRIPARQDATIYTRASGGPRRSASDEPSARRREPRGAGPAGPWLIASGALLLGACEVEWGGARLALENPAPPETRAAAGAGASAAPAPLPEGPLLYAVRTSEGGVRALVMPIARLGPAAIAPLDLPPALDAAYRARFDSLFLRPGSELALHAGGSRVGSLVVGPERLALDESCPSAAQADVLLVPGGPAPASGFAVPVAVSAAAPARWKQPEPDGRIRTYAPILAERLLREAGEPRPYLARLMALSAVPGEREAPDMAATYLIGDTLGPVAPAGEAVSLFFTARLEGPAYEPTWSILRRYGSARAKETYEWVERIEVGGRTVDVLLIGGEGRPRLGTSPVPGEADRIEWAEPAACPSPTLLSEAAAASGPASGG